MKGIYRKNRKKYDTDVDNSICQEDGIYCPTFNILHQQSIKAGQPFPLYRGKRVRWILIEKINFKEFVSCKN